MKAEMSHKKIPYQATLNWPQKIEIHKAPLNGPQKIDIHKAPLNGP